MLCRGGGGDIGISRHGLLPCMCCVVPVHENAAPNNYFANIYLPNSSPQTRTFKCQVPPRICHEVRVGRSLNHMYKSRTHEAEMRGRARAARGTPARGRDGLVHLFLDSCTLNSDGREWILEMARTSGMSDRWWGLQSHSEPERRLHTYLHVCIYVRYFSYTIH